MKEDTKQKYINKRYGDFIILSFVSNKRVLARCNWGKIVPIFLSSLTRKERTTTNCRECTIKRTINPNALSKNPTYKVYHGMVSRCKDIKNTASINYLLKGIKVSPIFLGVNGYSNFLKEVGERPNKNYSLDRIDPMKGYEPGNIRWATRDVQNLNKTNTIYVEHQEEKIPLKTIAKQYNIPYVTLQYRFKLGLNYKALIRPSTGKKFRKTDYEKSL